MTDKITTLLMRHLDLIDSSNNLSNRLLKAAKEKDVKQLSLESDNRDRLINVIDKFQKYIELEIQEISKSSVDPTTLDILKTWCTDVSAWVSYTDKIDRETTELLEEQKEEATKEIATIFKNRQQFKGYNLNNLKK